MNDSVNRRRTNDHNMDAIKEMLNDHNDKVFTKIDEVKKDLKEHATDIKQDMTQRMDRIESTLNQTQIKQGELDGRITNAHKQIGDLWKTKADGTAGDGTMSDDDDVTANDIVNNNFKYIAGLVAMVILGFFGFDFDDSIKTWVNK
jgi:hypothetical protein